MTAEVLLAPTPATEHDLRCPAWADTACDCRDDDGHAPTLAPFAVRAELERAWHDLTLRERAEQLDLIAAKGSLR